MRILKLSTLAVFILLTILPISCSTPKELEYRDFKNFTVDKLGFSSTTIKMDLVYYNPNNFGLQLKSTDLDVFVNNNYLGHTVQEQLVSIPRREEFTVPIKIDVDMKNFLRNGFNSIISSEVMIKVTGTVKVGKGSFFKSFPGKLRRHAKVCNVLRNKRPWEGQIGYLGNYLRKAPFIIFKLREEFFYGNLVARR